ncbi:MAG: RNA chaperone Hfq [Clostridia bacterium]|nr:RNA chaperone Hfq [Clostridia bacterium]
MSKSTNLQDAILNYVRKEKAFVSIYLTSGLHFKGNVIGFDNFVIILDCDGRQQMIYKHAVSTVVPGKSIRIDKLLSDGEE